MDQCAEDANATPEGNDTKHRDFPPEGEVRGERKQRTDRGGKEEKEEGIHAASLDTLHRLDTCVHNRPRCAVVVVLYSWENQSVIIKRTGG